MYFNERIVLKFFYNYVKIITLTRKLRIDVKGKIFITTAMPFGIADFFIKD